MSKSDGGNSEPADEACIASEGPVREAPDVAIATIYQNLAHSSILAMQNAVQQQQNTWTVQMAVTAKLVQQILSEAPAPASGDPLYDLFDDMEDFEDYDDEEGDL